MRRCLEMTRIVLIAAVLLTCAVALAQDQPAGERG